MDVDVRALAVFDDGSGPALYAGGFFTTAGGVAANRVARWDGSSWSALGSGMNESVWALTIYDDGSGPALYAGGRFMTAGGAAAGHVAKWNGSNWSALGSGIDGDYAEVFCLTVFDDGSGPALYAGGMFEIAGGVTAHSIAKWNGSSWLALGSGMNFPVWSLASFDDGSGLALYAGGEFTTAGGVEAHSIAKWNGTTWSPLGDGLLGDVLPYAQALLAFDDSSGPALYAGGHFTIAGGVDANRIAKWDGSSWSPLGSGMSGFVYALAAFDDGNGTALYAGGDFYAFDSADTDIAKWGGCPVVVPPWTNLGYALRGVSGPPLLVGTGALTPGSAGTLVLGNAAPSAYSVLFISLVGTPTPFKCGTLVPLPVALQLPLFTNGTGSIALGWASWPGVLSGLDLYFQYAIQDAGAACGVALSEALRADVP
jgi:hypothetical protein